MKSVTASIVILFAIAGLLFATPFYFASAQSLIDIDGLKDSFYNSLTGPNDGYIQIRYYAYDDLGMPPVNDADLSVKVWTAWDNEWFYLYEEVKDDSISANAVDVWGEDCLDLEFDPKPTVDNSNFTWQTFLTALGMGEKGVVNADSMSNVNDSDKKWIRIRTVDGYILELALRWSAIGDGTITPAVGNTFGMAVRQFDNDGKTFRQAGILWAAVLLNDVYDTPQYLGTVKFLADHKLQFIPTNAITGNSNPVPYDGSDYSRTDVPSSTEVMEKIKNNLLSNPPNTGNTAIRKQNILALDTILCSIYVHTLQSVLDLYTSMMEKVKTELRSKVDTGASIWMMYNDGYIVKTPKIVFAFDLVSGYDGWGTQLPLELIDQIRVLFISHTHGDHFDTSVTHRVLSNGGFVVVPVENSNIGNIPMAIDDTLTLQGLHIKAYYGLHGDVPVRMYEVTCASGLKFLHTGDNQTSETLPEISNVDALFLNAWVNESGAQPASIGICNCMNKIKPKIMIPGHIQELGHPTYYPGDPTALYYFPANPTGRYPYQVVYQIQDTSVAAKTHAMIWGELYIVGETVHSQIKIDTLLLEDRTIHLGDDDGNQGISYTKSFLLSDSQFSNLESAILKIEFIPPYGPNYEQPPILSINGTSLGSLQRFFPPINQGNWQTNADGSHDFNDSLHISFFVPITILVAGNNSFGVQNGRPDDDYQFTQVKIILSHVSIDDVPISLSSEIPYKFVLHQNYPNPFNPSTMISFCIPSKGFVSLRIFDLLGREVAVIVSQEMSAGSYSKHWNAANMPSGVYFYRLQSGSFTETKKLVLLR
jgi:L-ascorbate metabolism protein UlaG (beta-lactamase superfamily)